MSASTLGRLEKVELREFWESESQDFTPWLAKDENISLLADTIGLDLEVEAQETSVGPFSADILCKDTASDHWVLIENQLERTDHKHLGQLLTYAAGLNAVTIVWIADRFTDEHRAALDWLNEITDDSFTFFGLEVELWRIGDSPLAPKFNIVSKPNDWSRSITSAATRMQSEGLSEIRQLQLDYWTSFREYLQKEGSHIRAQKPQPQNWAIYAIGRSNFHLSTSVNAWDKFCSVGLAIVGPFAKPHYYLLEKDQELIEREVGEQLEWQPNPNGKQSYISLRCNHDLTIKNQWPEIHDWMKNKLELFHRTFSDRVKRLDASDYQDEE